MSEFALVLASDELFALGLGVALRSALVNLSPEVSPEIYVLDNGLSDSSRTRLSRLVAAARGGDIRWVEMPRERVQHLAATDQFTVAAYSRLLIGEILPDYVKRAVYLDSDVLVKGDVSPLFTVDLDGSVFGAVRDFVIERTDDAASGVRAPVTSRPYLNSGVLVVDTARWREIELGERVLRYVAAESEPLPWADQDALNAVAPSWHELDLRWNVQLTRFINGERPSSEGFARQLYDRRAHLRRTAAVLHFVGQKPWYGSCAARGRVDWVRALLGAKWFSRRETAGWLARYLAQWARYTVGTGRQAATNWLRRT